MCQSRALSGKYPVAGSSATESREGAAVGLPQDPIAQFHLGQVYAALEQHYEDITQNRRALDLAKEKGPAHAKITRLEALAPASA